MPRYSQPRKNSAKAILASLPVGETLDMFDVVRVTWPEVRLWVSTIAPHIGEAGQRFEYYVTGYNVAEKVRTAKAGGAWPPQRA